MRAVKGNFVTFAGAALALLFALSIVGERSAMANPRIKKQIDRKSREAMENYDLMEYEEAKRLLNEAIVLAKKAKLKDKQVAGVYVKLGIVYFSGLKDAESAKVAFSEAVDIDSGVTIAAAYKTGELEALLAKAKESAGSGGGGDGGGDTEPEIDCDSLIGIAHTIVDTAKRGSAKKITAYVSGDLGASKVALHYRSGGTDFKEAKMKKKGGCLYAGVIPEDAMTGEIVHYYVAVYNKSGKLIANKGTSGSPNLIELRGGGGGSASGGGMGSDTDEFGGGADDEDPFAKRRRRAASSSSGGGGSSSSSGGSGGSVSKGTSGPSKPGKFFVSIAVGTGGGYVSGTTEQAQNDVSCCFAPALFHVFPEFGYQMSAKNALSLAFRVGFPVGANMMGHATAAPAGLVRFRHALKDTGEGLMVSGAIGGGIIRHTVPLSGPNDGNTDTSATGPLLIGAGAGYVKAMGGSLKFVAELNVLSGIPIVDDLGGDPPVKPNFALHFDANLGLMLGF